MKIESHIVPPLQTSVRISDLPSGTFSTIPSRKGIKKAIKKGLVKVNGEIATTANLLKGGETIDLFRIETPTNRPIIDLNLPVIFEDEYLAIVTKPAGIVVSGNRKWTLEHALSSNLKRSSEKDALVFPEPIHRLDQPTTGALLIGKTASATVALNRLFAERKVDKKYMAVTIGNMLPSGEIKTAIDGKESKTFFELQHSIVSERFSLLNLVQLTPKTGRKHQLRKHLAQIGNPILGDREYGTENLILKGKGLYLHACSLEFVHPITEEHIAVKTSLPEKFLTLFPSER